MVLFNPALVLAPVEGLQLRQPTADLATRLGVSPEQLSPYHHIRQGAPPAVIFHGKADTTVPYATVEAFARKMAEAGNRCELYGYDGATHGFFNYGRGDSQAYLSTLQRMSKFLESLGYFKAQ
jgi:acetyl esterase/lipase